MKLSKWWIFGILTLFVVHLLILGYIADFKKVVRPTEIKPVQTIEVIEKPYTLIYINDYEYIKSWYIEGDRLYYTKQDDKKGSVASKDARLEQGWIDVEELDEYGLYIVN